MKKSLSLLASVLMLLPLFSCTKENQTTIEKTWVVSAKENPSLDLDDMPGEYMVVDLSESGKINIGILMNAELAEAVNSLADAAIAKENDVLLMPLPFSDVTISASGKSSGTISVTTGEGSLTFNYSKMTRTYVEVSLQDGDGEGQDVIAKLHTPKSIGLKLGDYIPTPEGMF